jgi:hypothetical protein
MEYVLIAFLAIGALGFIMQPVVTQRKFLYYLEDMFDFGDQKQKAYLNAKKATTLENLKELDFEYEMGKLSDEDYNRLRQDYLREAQESVQGLDKLKMKEEIEQLIEADVRARRRIQ